MEPRSPHLKEDHTLRTLFADLADSPASDWDTPSEKVWVNVASELAENRPFLQALRWRYIAPFLLLLALTRSCHPVVRDSAVPGEFVPFIPAETTTTAQVYPSAPGSNKPAIAVRADQVLPSKALQETTLVKELSITFIDKLDYLSSTALLPLHSKIVPTIQPANLSPIISIKQPLKPYWSIGASGALRFPQVLKSGASISPKQSWSIGLEAGYGKADGIRFTTGLEWGVQQWTSVAPVALTYREDQSYTDERGRLVRNYQQALSSGFGTANLDMLLANTRQNDGSDIQVGETMSFRVRTTTTLNYLSLPAGLEKSWKAGPLDISLRLGAVAHANISDRLEIDRVESLRARIQAVRMDLRPGARETARFYFDAYAGLGISHRFSEKHSLFLRGEYRHNISPVSRGFYIAAPAIQLGYTRRL